MDVPFINFCNKQKFYIPFFLFAACQYLYTRVEMEEGELIEQVEFTYCVN